jgi:hypothetical protein
VRHETASLDDGKSSRRDDTQSSSLEACSIADEAAVAVDEVEVLLLVAGRLLMGESSAVRARFFLGAKNEVIIVVCVP